ncbi:hypothetical protein HN873_052708, partial [Arachis hypogaea]
MDKYKNSKAAEPIQRHDFRIISKRVFLSNRNKVSAAKSEQCEACTNVENPSNSTQVFELCQL